MAFQEEDSQRQRALKLLDAVLLTRFTDDKMSKLVRQNKGGTFHLGMAGHELVGALSALSLVPGVDWGFPYYRDRAFAIGLGCSVEEIIAAFLARSTKNHSGGRMMPDHFSHVALRIPCQSSVVGAQFLQATGVAKGIALRCSTEIVYVSAGDGATSQGDFHEMLNFACLHKLPLVIVIQDNGWAISVPIKEQTAGGTIAKMARGYEGLTVHEVDGCDFLALDQALQESTAKARTMKGPSLIVAQVPRISPHSSSDDPQKYKTPEMVDEELQRDPVQVFEMFLLAKGWMTKEGLKERREHLKQVIEDAALKADEYPLADPNAMQMFCPSLEHIMPEEKTVLSQEPIVLMDALNHALIEEMERDSGVVVFGQDVARGKGGVFGITRTLTERFGEERCFNTPLAESTIVGLAIGLSVDGVHKPVAEIQFSDYSWTGVNQLFNELSSFYFRSNGEWNCPVVIRMPSGGYIQGGPYHSQSIEAFLCHCPGIKVVMPSNAADAKRLLKAAIRDPNPVVFLEHKALYRQRVFVARSEPSSDEILPLGKASVVAEGNDLTVVSWGMGVFLAHEVKEKLAKEGIFIEILDLRTLNPLDIESIVQSVKKTAKLAILHEAPKTCGLGAEISARIIEEAFSYLDAPVLRIAGKDLPVPYAKNLENFVLPQPDHIFEQLRTLARY